MVGRGRAVAAVRADALGAGISTARVAIQPRRSLREPEGGQSGARDRPGTVLESRSGSGACPRRRPCWRSGCADGGCPRCQCAGCHPCGRLRPTDENPGSRPQRLVDGRHDSSRMGLAAPHGRAGPSLGADGRHSGRGVVQRSNLVPLAHAASGERARVHWRGWPVCATSGALGSQSRREALTEIIGARRAWTVSMISALSMPCR